MADDHVIRSQLPGIFYRRPDPDSQPFVDVGDTVQAGSVVGVVEVMKQFHEVTAESAGTIASFEVENEQVVSPGDVVARLESTG